MGNNDFDSFGSTDGFDDAFGDSFGDWGNSSNGFDGDSNGFGDNSDGFGDNFESDESFGSNDDFESNSETNNENRANFADSITNLNNNADTSEEDAKAHTKKVALISIASAFLLIIILFFIASRLHAKSNNNSIDTVASSQNNNSNQITQQDGQARQDRQDTRTYDSVTNDNNSDNSDDTVIVNNRDDGYTWTEIGPDEDINFNEGYKDITFTVTSVENRARAYDTNKNLVVITKLQGSLSGLSGTFDLEVPYDKGRKLSVGDSFTVAVQLGTFKNQTVVGSIKY